MSTDRDLAQLLLEAEQRAGTVPALERRIAELQDEVRREHDLAGAARRQADADRARLEQVARELVEVRASPSWRLTRPLRAASRFTG